MTRRTNLTLVLFTYNFPYGKGEQFLETEITFLAQGFERIVVVPNTLGGVPRLLPPNVEVNASFANQQAAGLSRLIQMAKLIFPMPLFYRELLTRPATLIQPGAFLRTVVFAANASRRAAWIERFLRDVRDKSETILFYSYWFMPPATGLMLAKRRHPQHHYVSRAHGSDVYAYAHTPAYLPFWRQTVGAIQHIFPVSEHGQQYILQHGASPNIHCEVMRLGIRSPGFQTPASGDGILRIVSCSALLAIKRIPLLIQGLTHFAEQHPQIPIEWHHLGDGPLRTSLEALAQQTFPAHVTWTFHGFVPNQGVFSFYQDHPINLFINVSQSEGIPVSIMEAQSCGIPVIATAVGGSPEIVTMENGILLSSDPTPQEIADALAAFALHPDTAQSKRQASREMWETRYHAETNYTHFVNRLIELSTHDE